MKNITHVLIPRSTRIPLYEMQSTVHKIPIIMYTECISPIIQQIYLRLTTCDRMQLFL